MLQRVLAVVPIFFVVFSVGCEVPHYTVEITLSGIIRDNAGVPMADQAALVCAIAEEDPACGAYEQFEQHCEPVTTDAEGAYSTLITIRGGAGGHCTTTVSLQKLFVAATVENRWQLSSTAPLVMNVCSAEGGDDENCSLSLQADIRYGDPAPLDWTCMTPSDVAYPRWGGENGVWHTTAGDDLFALTDEVAEFFASEFPYESSDSQRFCIRGMLGELPSGKKVYMASEAMLDAD